MINILDFDSALNPKPRRFRKEGEEASEFKQGEVTEEAQETPVEDASKETPVEEVYEKKKKVVEEEDIKPEDRLERPENALSLAEYREQLKEKNKKLASAVAHPVKREATDLKQLEKDNLPAKVEKKVEKKKKHESPVQQIAVTFKTEDAGYRKRDERAYDNGKKKHTAPKFRPEDLPSL